MQEDRWKLFIAATPSGLCYVGSQVAPLTELNNWTKRSCPSCLLVQDDERLISYVSEIREYLQGNRRDFTIPFDLQGTPFQLAVWSALCEIPYGSTRSYSDIAHHIQKPSAVRAVGTAIGANPVLITVPCHRVVGKNGSLTGYRGGLSMKAELLKLERQK